MIHSPISSEKSPNEIRAVSNVYFGLSQDQSCLLAACTNSRERQNQSLKRKCLLKYKDGTKVLVHILFKTGVSKLFSKATLQNIETPKGQST